MNTLLFCFPHAGGSLLTFQHWQRCFADGIAVKSVQPPGRGLCFNEPPLGDYQRLVDRYADDILEALRESRSNRYAVAG
jgi:surfactin synthase thioesterase subunit